MDSQIPPLREVLLQQLSHLPPLFFPRAEKYGQHQVFEPMLWIYCLFDLNQNFQVFEGLL
jgi:hypothetical protein